MITLTIEDKKLESIFADEFHGNKESFFDFIKMSFDSFKNQDLSYLEDEIQKGFDSGVCEQSHDEIWDELFKKYA